ATEPLAAVGSAAPAVHVVPPRPALRRGRVHDGRRTRGEAAMGNAVRRGVGRAAGVLVLWGLVAAGAPGIGAPHAAAATPVPRTPTGGIEIFGATVDNPADLAAGPGGALWFTNRGPAGAIGRVSPAGEVGLWGP